jgi:hypothetical protein
VLRSTFAKVLNQSIVGLSPSSETTNLSCGPPWAHYLGGYQDRLLGGPLGLPDLCRTVPDGVRRKDHGGETRIGSYTYHVLCRGLLDVHD